MELLYGCNARKNIHLSDDQLFKEKNQVNYFFRKAITFIANAAVPTAEP